MASFAQLREAESKAQEEMTSKCFICSIERTEFDRKGRGFEYHIKNDHYMWNYLYFIVKIMQTEPEYYTSMELYVSEKVAQSDISWYPLHQAVVLDSKKDQQSDLDAMKKSDIDRASFEKGVMETMAQIKTELATLKKSLRSMQPETSSSPLPGMGRTRSNLGVAE